ncbi:hypothetical protein FUA23_07390 [Neolewinella aurantiaca]|uniref:DUF4340 domain-containing protein n=1 Tax=Neolewinella aurantiaca TaxID=2602767 RepID=A0A5C7FJM4_9BACT|nr:hypothetical protein [Neolewinella aurantiaca]TXF90056.1 hypothetical protein FUA23_07390 [Neolewinella aurantiaca]
MRTLIPLVILAAMAYAGWFYLQSFTDQPLRENLLLTNTNTLRELKVTNDRRGFRIFRGEEGGWIVKQDAIELYDQSEAADRLIEILNNLQTDSVMRRSSAVHGPSVILVGEGGQREELSFRFPLQGPPVVQVGATGDLFALPASVREPLEKMLCFDAYRGRRSLEVATEKVDSITVSFHDSLLWRVPAEEVPRLAKTFVAPATAPDDLPAYADYFDEVMDREKYFATIRLFAVADTHNIEVFRDSQWIKPYVLVGEDYPRTYFGIDSLR